MKCEELWFSITNCDIKIVVSDNTRVSLGKLLEPENAAMWSLRDHHVRFIRVFIAAHICR
jgi:hypothetical protein